jgi:hypothetical protein
MISFIDDWFFFSNYQVIGDPNIRIKFIYMYYDIYYNKICNKMVYNEEFIKYLKFEII